MFGAAGAVGVIAGLGSMDWHRRPFERGRGPHRRHRRRRGRCGRAGIAAGAVAVPEPPADGDDSRGPSVEGLPDARSRRARSRGTRRCRSRRRRRDVQAGRLSWPPSSSGSRVRQRPKLPCSIPANFVQTVLIAQRAQRHYEELDGAVPHDPAHGAGNRSGAGGIGFPVIAGSRPRRRPVEPTGGPGCKG